MQKCASDCTPCVFLLENYFLYENVEQRNDTTQSHMEKVQVSSVSNRVFKKLNSLFGLMKIEF